MCNCISLSHFQITDLIHCPTQNIRFGRLGLWEISFVLFTSLNQYWVGSSPFTVCIQQLNLMEMQNNTSFKLLKMWAKHKRTLKYVNVTAVLPDLVVKKRWNEKICTSMNRHNLLPSVFLTQTHTIPQTHTHKQEEDTSHRTFWTRLFHHYLNNLQMQLSYRLIMPFFIAVSK